MQKHFLLATATLVCATIVISNAGPLDPPAGPVVPTGKTLDEIEPRTPLSSPDGQTIVIDTPGSYYLTGDIDGAVGSGIRIDSGGVTIDLGGFAIRSDDADVGSGSSAGITISPGAGLIDATSIVPTADGRAERV
ncbi:MAG: hypothetical protein AAGH64_02100 [Planctomycetota bacterium]